MYPQNNNISEELPGDIFAKNTGYSLLYYSGNKKSASYTKYGVFLDIFEENGTLLAELSFTSGIITIVTPKFSIPGNFEVFEKAILKIKNKLEE